jgi:hypothetical protein
MDNSSNRRQSAIHNGQTFLEIALAPFLVKFTDFGVQTIEQQLGSMCKFANRTSLSFGSDKYQRTATTPAAMKMAAVMAMRRTRSLWIDSAHVIGHPLTLGALENAVATSVEVAGVFPSVFGQRRELS